MTTFTLTAGERQPIHAAIFGFTGKERQREYMRVRSRVLRLRPDYRAADNARKAALGCRKSYHANFEESRRKGAEKWARKVVQVNQACADENR